MLEMDVKQIYVIDKVDTKVVLPKKKTPIIIKDNAFGFG